MTISISFAADTTMVYANQLNQYYMFGGWNHLSLNTGRLYIQNRINNSSSVYSETARLKTQTDVNTDILYRISPSVRSGITGRFFLFKDGQTHHAYDYDQMRIGLKGDYHRHNYIVVLEGGYAGETRLDINDMGWYGGLGLKRDTKGLLFYPELNWDYSRMGQRRNYTFENRVSFHIKTPDTFRNVFSAGLTAYNREYYVTREADTEERMSLTTYLENELYYPVSKHVALEHKLSFSSSSEGLDFSYYDAKETRNRQFLTLQNDMRLRGRFGPLKGYVGFSNDYKQSRTTATHSSISLPADYIFDKKNFLTRVSVRLSERDSLSVNYLGSLLYYDTPDTNNYDDRDELTYSLSPAWHRRMGDYTSLTISANMFLHHYVYLYHQRSAQNHWNRVFSIRSEISTRIPGRIYWTAQQEIYANYFVYDYEELPFVHVQSMVFRGLKLQQNIDYFFSDTWFLRAYMFVRFEDNGLLDWDAFIQKITDSKYTIKAEIRPGFKMKRFQVSLGPSYSHRRDFRYPDIQTREPSYLSLRFGGVLSLQIANMLTLDYRLEEISQTGTSQRYNQSGSLRFTWIL